MLSDNISPSSIGGIKRLATQIKKEKGVQHAVALDLAAKKARFENFTHARRVLAKQAGLFATKRQLFLTIYWQDRDRYDHGRETLEIRLSKPLLNMCSKSELKMVRGLGGRLVAQDHLVSDVLAQSQDFARGQICKAVRALRFMEATGLRPSGDCMAAYPNRNQDNKLPGSDHPTDWYDPKSGQFILIDEPYSKAAVSAERAAWARQHGWHIEASTWPGIYSPYSCSFFVATNTSTGFDFASLMKKIDAMANPIVADDWNGVSVPNHETFVSPMAKTPQDKRRAKSKATVISQVSEKTVPYGAFFDPQQRRKPRATMPISSHTKAGKIIKSVLHSREKPWSVNKRMDSIRSTLEDWMGIEIGPNDPDGFDFFDVYYRNADEKGRYAEAAKSSIGLVEILNELKTNLRKHYPDCAPLRRQTSKIDTSISLIKEHVDRSREAA